LGKAAFFSLLLSGSFLYAGTPGFTRSTPALTVSVGAIEPGADVGSIGWTGAEAAVNNVFGGDSSKPGYEGRVLRSVGPERNNITSPPVSVPEAMLNADAVYVSGWIMRTTDFNSGGRVLLRNREGSAMAGFGITDVSSTPWVSGGTIERGHFAIVTTDRNFYSDEAAIANHWYEMVLVIRQSPDEPEKNTAYLFVRDASAGETDFRLIADIAGVSLNHTPSFNLAHCTNLRIEGFRANGQIGDIAAGTATLNLKN
jgi:hypothetical protein